METGGVLLKLDIKGNESPTLEDGKGAKGSPAKILLTSLRYHT
jgi:hypothetical protein